MNMQRFARATVGISLLASMIAQPALAYEYPLSSTAIREAYFLATGDQDKRVMYGEKYIKRYPVPKSGDYVGLIDFETPYMVVAQEIAAKGGNYHAPDAVKDFTGKPEVCRMRVEVYWGLNSVSAVTGRPSPDQTDYNVRVTQDGKDIPLKVKWTEPLVVSASASVEVGIAFYQEFDADNVRSGLATVEVSGATRTILTEAFDLDSVR